MSGRASSDLGSRGKSKNSSGLSKRAAHSKAASAAAALKRSVQPSPFALIGGRGDARGRGALSARSLLSGGRLDVEMDDAAARRPLFDSLPALASAAAMLCAPSAAAMLSGGAISRAVAVHGEHVEHIGSQSVFSRVDIDALIAECADLEAPLAARDAARSTSVVAPPQPSRRTRLQTLMSQDHDGSASADASASIITIAPPQPSRRTRTQDAAASTSVMASSRSSRRTSRRLALADSDGGRPVTAAGGASLTVSAAAAAIMRIAAAITRLCASMPAPAVAPAGVMTVTRLEDSRELARVRALAAARIDPATRLALSLSSSWLPCMFPSLCARTARASCRCRRCASICLRRTRIARACICGAAHPIRTRVAAAAAAAAATWMCRWREIVVARCLRAQFRCSRAARAQCRLLSRAARMQRWRRTSTRRRQRASRSIFGISASTSPSSGSGSRTRFSMPPLLSLYYEIKSCERVCLLRLACAWHLLHVSDTLPIALPVLAIDMCQWRHGVNYARCTSSGTSGGSANPRAREAAELKKIAGVSSSAL